jgi:hypothetical protein
VRFGKHTNCIERSTSDQQQASNKKPSIQSKTLLSLRPLTSFSLATVIVIVIVKQGDVHHTLTHFLQRPATPGSYAFVHSLRVVSGG